MKTKRKLFVLTTAIIAFILMAASCEKNPFYRSPQVETKAVTEITEFSALTGGIITKQRSELIFSKGICFSATKELPDLESDYLEAETDDLEFSILLEDLDPNTKYYVRAYVTNEFETVYGQTVSFTTKEDPFQAETKAVTEITEFSALTNGVITNQENKLILSKGICYSATKELPDLESDYLKTETDDLEFSILLEDLDPSTKYYVRAYASNESKTVYGQSVSFTTKYETITDIEGNEYRITQIGDQVWTIDNLQVTHFNDGTPIQNWTEDHYWDWRKNPPKEPAYSWYDNDYEKYGKIYGALYNFHVASDPRIAPEGWRVPTYEDGKKLDKYLGWEKSGDKMKLPGTEFWFRNTGATNSSGFSAKGAGFRKRSADNDETAGKSQRLKELGIFWTQTEWGGGMTMSLTNSSSSFSTDGGSDASAGLSIRLIKE